VPKAQDSARTFLRTSSVNILDSFIKEKRFNDTIKGVTIYSEKKNDNGTLSNIYLKKENNKNNFQITYAKNGKLIKKNNSQILQLVDGETISVNNNKITNFKFSKSDFNFQNMETNTTTYIKTQEVSTIKLIKCFLKLEKLSLFNINTNDVVVQNCVKQNQDNVFKELYKRLITPFYLPTFMLILLFLTLKSKENINYFKFKIIIFLLGITALVSSEMTLKFINMNLIENIKLMIIPLVTIMILYFIFYINLNLTKLKK